MPAQTSSRNRRDKRRLTQAARLEKACAILVECAGQRGYKISRQIAAELRCSVRTGQKLLVRAREAIAKQHSDALHDLAGALPERLADVIDRARKDGNLREEIRGLRAVAELVKGLGTDGDAGGPPDQIIFKVYDPAAGDATEPDQPIAETK